MNVSRETSLPDLLSRITNNLNINKDDFDTNPVFLGLTQSAASLILLSINNVQCLPTLIVADNNIISEKLYRTSYNLLPNKTTFFPESVKSGLDIPGFNLENERYRAESINFLRKNKSCLVFASSAAAHEPAIDKIVEEEISFILKVGETPDRQALLSALVDWGYEQTDHTETPKTFSTRGGILDIFLPYAANPTRIEFFGNTIDSIRMFNPRSQRTIKNIDQVEILPPPNKDISSPSQV